MPVHKDFSEMIRRLNDVQNALDYLSANTVAYERHHTLPGAPAVQFALAVLDFCEKNKMPIRKIVSQQKSLYRREVKTMPDYNNISRII